MSEVGRVDTVGLVGVGRMGSQLGRHLLDAGWPVLVADPDPNARRPLTVLGAREATSAAEVGAESDLVLVAVVDDEETLQAVAGPDGVLAGARSGTIVAICSSVRPATCKDLAERARLQGVYVVDVALVGGERGAEAAVLTLLCGGPDEVLSACHPPFRAFATSVVHLGETGAGQVGKAVNNILLWAAVRAGVEALRLGRALGVEPSRLRPAVAAGSGGNRVLLEWGQQRLRWPGKDLEIAIQLAEEAGVEIPLVRELARLMGELTTDDLRDLR